MTEKINRRSFVAKTLTLGAISSVLGVSATGLVMPQSARAARTKGIAGNLFELADLPYAIDALEPVISARIMGLHHGKHHAGYVRNLNNALESVGSAGGDLGAIISDLSQLPAHIHTQVRQNGGGALNHALFWDVMDPDGGGRPKGAFGRAIASTWGSFENFKAAFAQQASGIFGSGWAWLSVAPDDRLFISQTANQDNPLMRPYVARVGIPILGIDVWEHAYYLQYENRRGEYIDRWWRVVDWENVAQRYEAALTGQVIAGSLKV